MQSNRSVGWKRAKLTGHLNEDLVAKEFFDSNVKISLSGTKKVPSILGRKTPTKPDIIISYPNRKIRRSLKKSKSGQVHLNSVEIFINGFEKKYHPVSTEVKESLKLIFGGSNKSFDILNTPEFVHTNSKIRETELRRKTLCFETFKKYDEKSFNNMIFWFKDNIDKIATIIFKTGWVSDENNYADELWYKNLVDNDSDINKVYDIEKIINNAKKNKSEVYPKTKNGGTVINLPFGWVQYHQGQMQFHHSMNQIEKLLVD